ncbi:MAG: transcription antitermination factor NusB [Deltaproteobacteria bacterium]|nr:transcription antitermination factor NusB [Deltaproteobacteria bacterium]
MGNRRRSRELAMQALFQIELDGDNSSETLELFCKHFGISKKVRSFFFRLVDGVQESLHEIDPLIEQFSENWKMSRMSRVDRNVMRIAVYELIYCQDIPPKVSINEAIDIGKKYGTEDSGAFVNGILDSIRLFLEKESRLDPRKAQDQPGGMGSNL